MHREHIAEHVLAATSASPSVPKAASIIDDFDVSLNELETQLLTLTARLEPVLRQVPTEAFDVPAASSRIGAQLFRLHSLSAVVVSVIERLEV